MASAREYATKFREILAYLDIDNVPLIMQFYKGLKESIKDDLIKEDWPDTISAYIEYAI